MEKQTPNTLVTFEHLYQLYPDFPQYSTQNQHIANYQNITKRFSLVYGLEPTYFVKSPARITLFGDSCSYAGYSRLECALPKAVILAISTNANNQVRFNHLDKSIFPEVRISVTDTNAHKLGTHNSADYRQQILLALRVAQNISKKPIVPMNVYVHTEFLSRSKLSKTTAFINSVVLAQLTLMGVNHTTFKSAVLEQLNKFLTVFPQLTPNQTNLFAQNNKLLLLPSLKQHNFLQKYTLVLANSLTPEPLKLIQGRRLNLRQCEVLIGIQIIKVQLGMEFDESASLRELQNKLKYSLEDMRDCIQSYIPNKALSQEEIEQLCSRSPIQILKKVPFANQVLNQNSTFHPYRRISYFLREQQLISNLLTVLQSQSDEALKAQQFRKCMQSSQKNAKQLLEIESKEIDKLIDTALTHKMDCFKILGNSWGGNLLFLVEKHKVQDHINFLIEQYYNAKENQIYISGDLDQYVYEVIPSKGLAVLDPQYEMWF